MEDLEAVLIFMGPPVVGLVVVAISTTKTYREIIRISKNYLKQDLGTKLYNATSVLQRCITQLCLVVINFFKKLLLINLTFTRMLRNKCSIYNAKLMRSKNSIQMKDNMQKQLHLESCTKQDLQR